MIKIVVKLLVTQISDKLMDILFFLYNLIFNYFFPPIDLSLDITTVISFLARIVTRGMELTSTMKTRVELMPFIIYFQHVKDILYFYKLYL